MAVISITITQSSTQTIPGIPDTITIASNIPALIFFTLDGLDPNYNSSVYSNPIQLPQQNKNLTLKVYATDGTDSSAIITQNYTGDFSGIKNIYSGNARTAQSTSNNNAQSLSAGNSLFPFGTNTNIDNINYSGVGNPDNTVYNEGISNPIPNAFDENGNPTSFSNLPIDPFGQVPIDKNVKLIGKNGPVQYVQEESNSDDKLFNPKALVIYHDANNLDPLTPQIINRSAFSLENTESIKDGILLTTHHLNSPTITGSFIRSFYNPNTGKMTNYYRDASVNRWIISSWDFSPTNPNLGSLGRIVFGREEGSQYVYPWILWQKRTLM